MMNYFGTELDGAGHYFWTLEGNAIYRSRTSFENCPFNPEALPYKKNGQGFFNGTARFYQFAGFSIYAIEGSCKDERPGSKSIFFVEKELDKDQMKALILATPIASKIIQKMPFKVEW
jgi:hypothetical protein